MATSSCALVIGRTASDVSDEEARAEAEGLFRQAILANPINNAEEPRLALADVTEDRSVWLFFLLTAAVAALLPGSQNRSDCALRYE